MDPRVPRCIAGVSAENVSNFYEQSGAGMKTPAQEAVERLEKAVSRSKRKSSVRLPVAFARDAVGKPPTTPLARLMRGGGEVRLKVFLTTLMMATKGPHETKVSSKDLAAMLDLSEPDAAGGRRVSKAFKDLADVELVERVRVPGHVPSTKILNPAGNGKAWDAASLEKPYITLPIELWHRGWIVALSGRALALLIILRELTSGREGGRGWADGTRKRQYGISDDTWTRGTKELVDAGLLEVTEQVYASYGEPRRRNIYKLRLERLAIFDPGKIPGDADRDASDSEESSQSQ